jgi:hypothetical protein
VTVTVIDDDMAVGPWLSTLLSGRPHQVIGDPADPYLLRWFLIPRNPVMNIYRQAFTSSGLLKGLIWSDNGEIAEHRTVVRRPGSVAFRRATSPHHRVELLGHPVTTVIITGPRCRPWGFWCPRPAQPPAFVPWRQFGSGGCGEYPTPPTPEGTRTQ